MTVTLGEIDALRTLANRLDEVGHGKRKPLVQEAAKLLNCSEQTVYRRLKSKIGWESGRKRRNDRGKCFLDEETAMKASYMITKGASAVGKKRLQISTVRDILAESGQGFVNPETGEVIMPSASTLSRTMRAYSCHPDQLKNGNPHIHMRSLHPNHCWQVDPSLCVLFYLPKGKVKVMEEKDYYKNKPGNLKKAERERVWRYVITDHYSGTIYVRYVQAAGESAQGLVDVFLDAVIKRGPHDPMHGLPFFLYMDKGSANMAHLFINLLDRLQIRWETHQAGSPRSKGQVECANSIVETQFEARLRFMEINSIAELQAEADKWRQHYNANAIHSRTGKSRNAMWLTITEKQLRLAPSLELCRELVTTKPKKAKVAADLSISHTIKGYGRNDYDLRMVGGIMPQMQVMVVVNPYRAPAVDVTVADPLTGDETVWTVEPVKKDEAGFWENGAIIGEEYKSHAETKAEKILNEFDEMSGTNVKPGANHCVPPENVNPMADVKPAPEYMPRRGRDLWLDASRREVAPYKLVEAAMILKNKLGDQWTGEAYAWLEQRYGNAVPHDELDSIVERFSRQAEVIAPLRVVNGQE
ncbi:MULTISPECIES: hypothetical protein [unclassified Maridesulfovibrio]|uniref:hypothetical protein n=1 Tax=unclassified Maridesulfovibrio TaxID=2794999 RepID=UPI003B42235C